MCHPHPVLHRRCGRTNDDQCPQQTLQQTAGLATQHSMLLAVPAYTLTPRTPSCTKRVFVVRTAFRPGKSKPAVKHPAASAAAAAAAAAGGRGGGGSGGDGGPASQLPVRLATLRARHGAEALGLRIRGGAEYNLGIYVSEVDGGGIAEQAGQSV